QALTSDLETLYTAIDSSFVNGNTSLDLGIYEAALELWSSRARTAAEKPHKTIVVLSDGKSDLGSARTQADRAKSSGIRIISIGVPTPSNGDLTVDADVLTAIASSASTYLATDGPDQIASRLLQVATDSCSLTRPDRPLNGTVYANDQRPQTVCDTFTVKEDSADNILDI